MKKFLLGLAILSMASITLIGCGPAVEEDASDEEVPAAEVVEPDEMDVEVDVVDADDADDADDAVDAEIDAEVTE